MAKNMDQSEIDAMFAEARASAASEMPPAPEEATEHLRKKDPYSFSRAGQISNDQMRAISTVNDLFARNLTHNLGAWLRTSFGVALVSGEQMVYSEFLERVPPLAYVCSVRLEPLDAVGLVHLDLSLAPPIVDLLLGGVGRAGLLREPTEIEHEILMSVMEIVTRELNVAWQPVGLKFQLEKREAESQVARLMSLVEKTLCVSFDIKMPEALGTLNLCLPAVVLNAILRRLISERDRPRRRSMEAQARVAELMAEAKFGAVLQFAPMRLKASELAKLEPGFVLRLPLARHAAAEMRVAGLPVFGAQPVRLGEHRGAQVHGLSANSGRMNGA